MRSQLDDHLILYISWPVNYSEGQRAFRVMSAKLHFIAAHGWNKSFLSECRCSCLVSVSKQAKVAANAWILTLGNESLSLALAKPIPLFFTWRTSFRFDQLDQLLTPIWQMMLGNSDLMLCTSSIRIGTSWFSKWRMENEKGNVAVFGTWKFCFLHITSLFSEVHLSPNSLLKVQRFVVFARI